MGREEPVSARLLIWGGTLELARFRGTHSGRLASVASKRVLRLAFALAVVAAIGSVAATSSARAGGKQAVSQGIGAAVLPSTPFGDTPADTPETVSFVLQANDLHGLEEQVSNGMPGGFLSVHDFARRFGQSQQNISALERYLAHYGISSHALADGLEIQSSGTAGEYDAALSVQQHQYHVPPMHGHDGGPGHPGGVAHGTKQTPLLPRELARFVLSIFGLSNYPTMQSNMVGVPKTAQPKDLPNNQLLPADFATRYNLDPVY